MLAPLVALAVATAAASAPACPPGEQCVQATAAQLFALAEKLYEDGDLAGAATMLEALTQDVHPELRAEARFRLAALREKMGDLDGSVRALRELLAEQPGANRARLELARLLALMGKEKDARAELARAEALGLPPEVQQNVRRFASSLPSNKRRGFSLELASGPDSNMNRSTSDQYVDTIIAPFELDPDARGQSGIGFTTSGQAFTRNGVFGMELLTRAGFYADLFSKSRFNDIQLTFDAGPEWQTRLGRIRPAIVHERRWYSGDPYSTGFGGSVDWLVNAGPRTQVEFDGSVVRQDIGPNDGQDGWRYSIGAEVSQALSGAAGARLSLRYAALDARVRPESLRQLSVGLFVARRFEAATLFGEVDYSRTRGIEPLFLFGKTRRDKRVDLSAGAVLSRVRLGGFSPLLRVLHTRSGANIALYDYRRTRLDVGFSRSF